MIKVIQTVVNTLLLLKDTNCLLQNKSQMKHLKNGSQITFINIRCLLQYSASKYLAKVVSDIPVDLWANIMYFSRRTVCFGFTWEVWMETVELETSSNVYTLTLPQTNTELVRALLLPTLWKIKTQGETGLGNQMGVGIYWTHHREDLEQVLAHWEGLETEARRELAKWRLKSIREEPERAFIPCQTDYFQLDPQRKNMSPKKTKVVRREVSRASGHIRSMLLYCICRWYVLHRSETFASLTLLYHNFPLILQPITSPFLCCSEITTESPFPKYLKP